MPQISPVKLRESRATRCTRIYAEIPCFASSGIGREMQHGKRAGGMGGRASWRNCEGVDGSPASGSQSPSIYKLVRILAQTGTERVHPKVHARLAS
jgi:hypothetical protein